MKKILAVDLDGTLLTIDKTIRKEDLLALQRWKASGNLLAINTGRPLSYYKQIKKLGVDLTCEPVSKKQKSLIG